MSNVEEEDYDEELIEGEETLGEDLDEEQLLEEAEEVESVLTEYDPEDFYSGAVVTEGGTLPPDLFDFHYDCKKYFNLCACDESVVCWAAGSVLTFMDVNTKQIWFRRSTTGGSIGALTSYRKDPYYRIAVCEGRENDTEPLVILYTWPQMEIDAVLRDGTTNQYTALDFSPDGELLATVGREPDYNLTIWNWRRHKIMLRTSAFTFDVDAVMFSPYCPGQLTTSGSAHIKFWKMAQTFTGLKLMGDLGRFGKTEICDVLGVYPMPDEKIQFMLSPAGDEVTTVARDGCVRVWYWDTVDQADPPEDDPYIEINPVAETCVPGCEIMCLKHQKDMFWYAQDGKGGIWTVELEIDKEQCQHSKVLSSHAGGVVGLVALRTGPILLSAGQDGALMAYHTETHALLARYQFGSSIKCMLYPPVDVDITSRILLVGFADGILRTLFLHPERFENLTKLVDVRVDSSLEVHSTESLEHGDLIDLIALQKPHSKAITQISINDYRTLLVTCGQDSTIFLYSIVKGTPFQLERIGFIETPNNVEYMTWKPGEEFVILLCGQVGLMLEAVLPTTRPPTYEDITTFQLEFASYKEVLVKKYFMRHRPFPTEEDLASLDEEALKAKGASEKDDDDEEAAWLGEIELMESESMLGTPVSWAAYTAEGIWAVQRGTGALLLVRPGEQKILKYAPFPGAWCEDLTVLRFICDGKYLLFGTNTGYVRVVRMPTPEEDNETVHFAKWMKSYEKLMKKLKGRRLAKEEKQPIPRIDFEDRYYLPMHDFYTGAITCFEFNSDGTEMYTSGRDGNIFSYRVNFDEPLLSPPEWCDVPVPPLKKMQESSTLDSELLSHEQLKQKEEYEKMMAIANAHKKLVREKLHELGLEFNKIVKANKAMPVSQQIDLTIDPRPLEVFEKELDEAKALTKRKLAHQLEASDLALHKMHSRNILPLDVFPFSLKGIGDSSLVLRPLRQKNLSEEFQAQLDEVGQKMAEAAMRGRRTESSARRAGGRRPSCAPPRIASFLLGLPPRPPHPLKKALRNYHARLTRHHMQFLEFQEHLSRKPDPNALPPGAAEALKEAEGSIGNRVLKTHPDYVAPHGHNTQLRVCMTRKEIYDIKHDFNMKVVELREDKLRLVERVKQIGERINEMRVELPAKQARPPPPVPDIDLDLEFPERHLEVRPEPIQLGAKGKALSLERRSSVAPRARPQRVPRFVPLLESRPLAATFEFFKYKNKADMNPIEIEILERRVQRHLFEQDVLIEEANELVRQFDARLIKLQRERIRVQEKSCLLELQICLLHQEMNVLNRFEAHEDKLAERVYNKLMQVQAVHDQIGDCERRIEEHEDDKETLGLECQELQRKFKKLVQDNKFADFLRRIFKKKYRPPRDRDDEESESESSSSSSDEDEVSLDSFDIGPIRLDPTVCPEGCDLDLYNMTYELRNTRHKYEQEMIEQDRYVELLKKDIEAHNKVKRSLGLQLEKRKNVLREFMLEKQNCLNEVTQVVVLRYSQIRARALREAMGPRGLANAVVFSGAALDRLKKRVTELYDEIREQRKRQKVNRTHLHRMNVDLKAMEARAAELKAKMRDVLTKKLGKPRQVDKTLDDLLKQMARAHKYTATATFVPLFNEQLKEQRMKNGELEQQYFQKLKQHSERLRLAATLQADSMPRKPTKDPSQHVGGYSPAQYRRDVVRLRIIHSQQLEIIEALKSEIVELRTKPIADLKSAREQHKESSDLSQYVLKSIESTEHVQTKKYFPILPLGSASQPATGSLTATLHRCLDAMRLSREHAQQLLLDVSGRIPLLLQGTVNRYDVIEEVLARWLPRGGGDPDTYNKHTLAFDSVAALIDRLIKDNTAVCELASQADHAVMQSLEDALKDVSDVRRSLKERVAPTLAALIHVALAAGEDLETDLTLTSFVNSLVEETAPTAQSIDDIDEEHVVDDIEACGVGVGRARLAALVSLALRALRAQAPAPAEEAALALEADRAMEEDLATHARAASKTSQVSSRSRTSGSRSVKSIPSTASTSSKKSTRSATSSSKTTRGEDGDGADTDGVKLDPTGLDGADTGVYADAMDADAVVVDVAGAEGADAKGADAQGADAKGADAKGADAKSADAKDTDDKDPDAEGPDAKGADPGDGSSHDDVSDDAMDENLMEIDDVGDDDDD